MDFKDTHALDIHVSSLQSYVDLRHIYSYAISDIVFHGNWPASTIRWAKEV